MNIYLNNAKDYIKLTKNIDMDATYQKVLPFLTNKKTVLDLGCGSGRDSLFFHHQGFQVTAADYSPAIVNVIKAEMPFPVIEQDITRPTITTTFDAIWACASLLHVSTEQQELIFTNLNKLLNPNGILYCSYKVGPTERMVNQLVYRDYTEAAFRELQNKLKLFTILNLWESEDSLDPTTRPKWLNVVLEKN